MRMMEVEKLTSEESEGKTGAEFAPINETFWSRALRALIWFKGHCIEHWFMIGLGFAIGFAYAVPDFGRPGGWVASQYSIKYGAVIVIFFLSGISLKPMAIGKELSRVHLHLLLQVVSLALIPVIGYGIGCGLGRTSMHPDMANGVIVALALPTTIATNVVFTARAGGNEPIALINAVVGNVIGIFITPAWLNIFVGVSSNSSYGNVIQNLVLTVVAPFVIGQIVLVVLPKVVKWIKSKVDTGRISNCMTLLLVWSTFCGAFSKKIEVDARSVVGVVFLMLGLYIFFVVLCLGITTFRPIKALFRFSKADAIAFTICGSTKTLALGMPIIANVYEGSSRAGVLALPLLIYHAIQVLLGSLSVRIMAKWIKSPNYVEWPVLFKFGHADVELTNEASSTATQLPSQGDAAIEKDPKLCTVHLEASATAEEGRCQSAPSTAAAGGAQGIAPPANDAGGPHAKAEADQEYDDASSPKRGTVSLSRTAVSPAEVDLVLDPVSNPVSRETP